MVIETKEEVLHQILSQKRPLCPYCNVQMSLWEVPQFSFSNGLGWGVPYLYVCFNNDCPMYKKGWDNILLHYGQHASYRCILFPDTQKYNSMTVFSPEGGTGQIIDKSIIARREAMKAAIEKDLSMLSDLHKSKDWQSVLKILCDPDKPQEVRMCAAEIIGEIGELEIIEPLRSHTFDDEALASEIEQSVTKIHERHFTRECPFCAEIIKKRASICRYCGKKQPSSD